MSSHKSLDEVKEMIAHEEAGHHGGSHDTETKAHVVAGVEDHSDNAHKANAHDALADAHSDAEAHHGDEHAEHVLHQIHNRPYAAL